jgi:hypothetical protein
MVRFSKKKIHHTLFIINQINKHSREIKGEKKMGLKKEKKVFMKNKGNKKNKSQYKDVLNLGKQG